MATLYKFSDLKSKKAKERALEEYIGKNQYQYPESDDVQYITEYLSEWLQNALGVDHDPNQLYWDTYPYHTVQINCHSGLDYEHLEKRIKNPELGLDADYDGLTGAQIIAKQKKVITAWRVLQMQGKLLDTAVNLEFNCKIDNNRVEDVECYYDTVPDEDADAIEAAAKNLEEETQDYIDFCARELARLLEADIDWHNSEEYILERLQDDDYTEFNYKGEVA